MTIHQHPWALVIFACRESLLQLRQTLDAALLSAGACAAIHVLVNGNSALANALVVELTQRPSGTPKEGSGPAIKVWSIPLADKANAWNQYIHQIWSGETIAFFIDGYVRLNPDAVELLGSAVEANVQALGGTGVPTMGRSAKALRKNMIINTGYHGNFCCLKGETVRQMRDKLIRLPVGLYRTDSLMGAILCYGLDPGNHIWEDHRIHVHPTASWQIDPAKWWRVRDLSAYLKRYVRQVRGKIENAAFADHLANRRCSPATLPPTVQELVLSWERRCPAELLSLCHGRPLVKQAMRQIRRTSSLATGHLLPELIWQSAP